jgi:hypothetical protein
MKKLTAYLSLIFIGLFFGTVIAEDVDLSPSASLTTHNAVVSHVEFKGKTALKVEISEEARLELAEAGILGGPGESKRVDHLVIVERNFHNGTIELEVSGEPALGAVGGARGFVGVAFRLQPDLKTYDTFYLRPTNGRAEDQERRNHSAQYISHPDWPWYRLRSETPSKYESYVDLQPATWTKIKIVVEGDEARLFVHDNEQPTIIVNDLKSGANGIGAIALWFEGSTIAHYSDLKITKQN